MLTVNRRFLPVLNRSKRLFWSALRLALLLGLVFIILSPLIYYFSNAVKSADDMRDITVMYIPREPTLHNFRMFMSYVNFMPTLFKTIGFTSMTAVLQTASCLLIGYGLARFRFPGSKLMFGLIMMTLVIPPQIILVPVYIRFKNFNILELFKFSGILSGVSLINTPWPVILLAAGGLAFKSGLYIFLLRQFFRNMPVVLEEAASIDGCGTAKIFLRIMLPNAVPMVITVFLFSFVLQWNDYFYSNMLMPNLPTLTMQITKTVAYFRTIIQSQLVEQFYYPSFIMLILPLVVLYIFTQRFFVESVARSGIVG